VLNLFSLQEELIEMDLKVIPRQTLMHRTVFMKTK
jgi:hypothetical protein